MNELITRLFNLWERLRPLASIEPAVPELLHTWDETCSAISISMLVGPETKLVLQHALTGLSNHIYSDGPRAGARQMHLQLLNRLETLMEDAAECSRYRQRTLKWAMADTAAGIREQLIKQHPSHELAELVLKVLTDLRRTSASPPTLHYLENLFQVLRASPPVPLTETLVKLNFNHPLIVDYLIRRYRVAELTCDSLSDLEEMLMDAQRDIQLIAFRQQQALITNVSDLPVQLMDFLEARLSWVSQRQRQKRAGSQDQAGDSAGDRQEMKTSVAMIGVLIRLLTVVGILPDEDAGKTFGFFARRFFTAKAPFMSAHSLQNRANSIDYQTAVKFKELLIKMLNWLNSHCNTGSYRG